MDAQGLVENNPILNVCPWARKHMAAEVRLRVENALRTARKEEAQRLAKQAWMRSIVTRHLNERDGVESAIKMIEESVACAYAAWAILRRSKTSDLSGEALKRLGELEYLANYAQGALNGVKNTIALEKWAH